MIEEEREAGYGVGRAASLGQSRGKAGDAHRSLGRRVSPPIGGSFCPCANARPRGGSEGARASGGAGVSVEGEAAAAERDDLREGTVPYVLKEGDFMMGARAGIGGFAVGVGRRSGSGGGGQPANRVCVHIVCLCGLGVCWANVCVWRMYGAPLLPLSPSTNRRAVSFIRFLSCPFTRTFPTRRPGTCAPPDGPPAPPCARPPPSPPAACARPTGHRASPDAFKGRGRGGQ